ncbi:MAG: endonuclease [Candidatus Riflebacteria bacterium]|nr:endonuclease [Candidatus Riflebacteria bacterium]
MISENIKKCVLMLGLSVALSTGTTFAAQEGNDTESARQKLLDEAITLLDKVELNSPKSQVEVTRIREKLVKLKTIDATDDSDDNVPELMFSHQGGNSTSVSRANKAKRVSFYNSCKGLRNGDLLKQLRAEVSKHKSYDYTTARELVILGVDNHGGDVECVYTGKVWHVGTEVMPPAEMVNIEHTWPQSKGAKGVAKTDIHHLYPTDSKANSIRGNHPFGLISDPNPKFNVGGSKGDGNVFEVRKQHRGNVARSMFYFATVYNQKIDEKQEQVLRKWHKEDPVDANEMARNDKVEALQNNRNPYIDHPEYVDMIDDF